ncbi:FadR family transcriptional regulator, partial [Streptomyces sp. SID11233]|nr:FadR family transcriptional regulator [Streptomyces sp. SID11233]
PRDFAELRVALESTAARLAAQRRTAKDVRLLENALERRDVAWKAGDTENFVVADATFHLAVVAASHNSVITEVYADLGEVLRDWLREDIGEMTAAHDLDHHALFQAIADQDGEKAATEAGGIPYMCRPALLGEGDRVERE